MDTEGIFVVDGMLDKGGGGGGGGTFPPQVHNEGEGLSGKPLEWARKMERVPTGIENWAKGAWPSEHGQKKGAAKKKKRWQQLFKEATYPPQM